MEESPSILKDDFSSRTYTCILKLIAPGSLERWIGKKGVFPVLKSLSHLLTKTQCSNTRSKPQAIAINQKTD